MKNLYLWLVSILSVFFHMTVIRVLKDQRGETAPDETEEEIDPGLENVSLNLDGEEDDIVPEVDESEEEEVEEKEEKVPEIPKEIQSQIDDLNNKLQKQLEVNSNLKRAVSEERKKNKSADEPADPPLTEAQVLALYREHKDDPDTLFNLVKYQIEQGTKKAKTEAVDIAEISRIQKDIDAELSAQFPDIHDENSDLRRGIDDTKAKLKISDHPFSDLLAIGAMAYKEMPQLLKVEFEKGKAEGLKEKTEAARKSSIKNGDLGDGDKKPVKKNTGKLNSNLSDIANRIGLSEAGRKTYANLISKKGSVEV